MTKEEIKYEFYKLRLVIIDVTIVVLCIMAIVAAVLIPSTPLWVKITLDVIWCLYIIFVNSFKGWNLLQYAKKLNILDKVYDDPCIRRSLFCLREGAKGKNKNEK